MVNVLELNEGLGWLSELPSNSYKPIANTAWARAELCKLQKECTRLTAANDKVYQLLAQDRRFSPGTPASSTTKTDRHDMAEILLKVALKHQKLKKSMELNNFTTGSHCMPNILPPA